MNWFICFFVNITRRSPQLPINYAPFTNKLLKGPPGTVGFIMALFKPTVITNNFGSLTTVTVYFTEFPVTSYTVVGSSSSASVYITTQTTATSYSTPTPPLTTTFTPPASCLSEIYDIGNYVDYENFPYANGVLTLGPPGASQCYPYGWASSIYYSPGFCPQGYITVSASLNFLDSSKTTETVATCCPRLVC